MWKTFNSSIDMDE